MLLGERNWTEVQALTNRVVVQPIGALEQHGHHLPLLTDSLIGGEIARRAEDHLGDTALFLPMLWLGASDHHRGFAGTVSLSTDVYRQVLNDILESLIGSGFRRILLLNSHAGNINAARIATYEVNLRYHNALPDLWLVLASWFDIAQGPCASLPDMVQTRVIHACEWETSMVLRLRPELVDQSALDSTRIPSESAFYCPDFQRASRVDVARTFDQVSGIGAFGYPEMATPEKGEALFAAAAQEVVAFVREFAGWTSLPEKPK